eukprot:5586753-Heterocapsa_arctica.AAC.1
MPALARLLQEDQDPLHIADVLVHLVAAGDQLLVLDAVVGEVGVKLLAIERLHLVVHHGHAAAQGLVHVREESVLGVQDPAGNLDGCGDIRAHHGLDGRSVLCGQRQGIALPVDRRRVDGMRISCFQVLCILQVRIPRLGRKLVPDVLDHLRVALSLRQGLHEFLEGLCRLVSCKLAGQLFQENGQAALRHAPE